jgi:NitT/TauT family transport system permease protein
VRQGIGRGLVGLVAGEFFLSGSGIGLLIMTSERDFDVPGLYGSILVVAVIGAALMAAGRVLENRFAAWRGLQR